MDFKVRFRIKGKIANVMVRNAKDKSNAYLEAYKHISAKHPLARLIEVIEVKGEAEKLANIMGFSFKRK